MNFKNTRLIIGNNDSLLRKHVAQSRHSHPTPVKDLRSKLEQLSARHGEGIERDALSEYCPNQNSGKFGKKESLGRYRKLRHSSSSILYITLIRKESNLI